MVATNEVPEPTATPAQAQVTPKQYVSRWRTAGERADALRAKKQRRRAAHRVALKRSHANG
jgi:hypothetical protein